MLLRKLWRDQRGVINSIDLILGSTILVLGMIVGLVCLRNQVVQELSDTANAIGSFSQSFSYSEKTITYGGDSFTAAGATYVDQPNVDADIDVTSYPPSRSNLTPGEG